MKKQQTPTDKLLEVIFKDINTVPKFIDGKKDLQTFRLMQCILYTYMKLTKPQFLSDYSIGKIDEEIQNDSIQLELITEESLYSVIVVYLNKKLMGYYDKAMELELFECASNIKKYFDR